MLLLKSLCQGVSMTVHPTLSSAPCVGGHSGFFVLSPESSLVSRAEWKSNETDGGKKKGKKGKG